MIRKTANYFLKVHVLLASVEGVAITNTRRNATDIMQTALEEEDADSEINVEICIQKFVITHQSKGLRAELGIVSIESAISKKKLMFLHRVLNQPENNITKRVLLEQRKLPGETWLNTTLALCQKLNLSDNLEEIEGTSKESWKREVMKAINTSEEKSIDEWVKQSKKYNSETVNITKKDYINYLPPALAMTILKARLGMTEVKSNYKNMYTDTKCRKCHKIEEDLKHILQCNSSVPENKDQIVEDLREK